MKIHEWMYKVDNEQHWNLCTRLMTEEQATRWFTAENIMKNEFSKLSYKKTGRTFPLANGVKPDIVIFDDMESDEVFRKVGYESEKLNV